MDMEKRGFFLVVMSALSTVSSADLRGRVFSSPASKALWGHCFWNKQSWKLVYCIRLVFGFQLQGAETVPRLELTEFGVVTG